MSFGKTEVLVFVGLLTLRTSNAVTIKTFFQPDEYFQVLEPAWQLAFGPESGAWITWEWKEQLRSSLHPILFSRLFLIIDLLGTQVGLDRSDRALALLFGPKVLQGVLAAIGDFAIWALSRQIYGRDSRIALCALILTIFNPWQWFCSTRTFANCLETVLTSLALHFWPWQYFIQGSGANSGTTKTGGLKTSLTFAAVACILRPTNGIIWATITLSLLIRSGDLHKALRLILDALLCGGAVVAVSLASDTMYFGKFTFPPLKFLYFNVVQSLAVFYGTNRPDYYLSEGVPLLLTTSTPFALVGLWESLLSSRSKRISSDATETVVLRTLALAIISTVLVLSLISHKEVRFIYPLLPMLLVIAAKPFTRFFSRPTPVRSTLFALWALGSMSVAYYVSFIHQRGVVDVMHYLRHESEPRFGRPGALSNVTVGFLMPCHSTPWRSHLVYPEIRAWALTCEPPLHVPLTERSTYMDEADVFYEDPALWLKGNMDDGSSNNKSGRRSWPDYLVFFEQLEPVIIESLAGSKYRECWRGFNTHWHDDWRRQGDVVVWCQEKPG